MYNYFFRKSNISCLVICTYAVKTIVLPTMSCVDVTGKGAAFHGL